MPGWLLSILALFAKPVIDWALNRLEVKYPGLTAVIEMIKKFVDGSSNPAMAMQQVQEHTKKLCVGTCPADLKGD